MGENVNRAVAGLVGAGVAAGVYAVLSRRADASWRRTDHAGRTVTLYEGPAAAIGAAAGIAAAPGPARDRAAGVLAVPAAAGCGAYDDLVGADDPRRGFRAHLGALRGGEVTGGAVKLFGIGAAGALAGLLIEERVVDGVLTGGDRRYRPSREPRRRGAGGGRGFRAAAGGCRGPSGRWLPRRCSPPPIWGNMPCSGTPGPMGSGPRWGSPWPVAVAALVAVSSAVPLAVRGGSPWPPGSWRPHRTGSGSARSPGVPRGC